MARIITNAHVELHLQFVVNEAEARALEAMAGYGVDNFVKAFYQRLGESYMQKHEAGLRSFLKAVKDEIPVVLVKVDEARKAFQSKGGE